MSEYDHKNDWFYEGQVSQKLVDFLKSKDFVIEQDNSKNIKAHGPDIVAKKEAILLVVEVKGYPTIYHTKGPFKGQAKKTKPKDQAKHWFSEVILSSIYNHRNFKDKSNVIFAIAFPLVDRYKDLMANVKVFFAGNNINFPVFFIDEQGKVEEANLNPTMNKQII